MSFPEAEQFKAFMARTAPGPGIDAAYDGVGGEVRIRGKSIPNVSTLRLAQRLLFMHDQFHTAEGLARFDGPRRDLVNNGFKIKMIRHEMLLRGANAAVGCPFCD
jgi:hypothetical protein